MNFLLMLFLIVFFTHQNYYHFEHFFIVFGAIFIVFGAIIKWQIGF